MTPFYEPLLERDVEGIRREAARLEDEELYLAVARFAVLAYAPTQHSKHAVVAALAAHELREEAGEGWRDLVIECAIYAAQSRRPWSEPPILDPPEPAGRGDLDELREAIEAHDRLRAERWLAKRIDDDDLERDLLTIAGEDAADFGHKAIMTTTAFRLSRVLGEKGRFAALRIAVWEMTAYGTEEETLEPLPVLLRNAIAENGSFESVHKVFRCEALRQSHANARSNAEVVAYPLARDYAQYLEAQMVVKRLRATNPELPFDAFLDAVKRNLDSASYEEWSFA